MEKPRDLITKWFEDAKESGATHLIVVFDPQERSFRGVPIKPPQTVENTWYQPDFKLKREWITEVYNLSLSLTEQLQVEQTWNNS